MVNLNLNLLLFILSSCCVFSGEAQQEQSDYRDNDMLLNAIHSNETPSINKAIAELR